MSNAMIVSAMLMAFELFCGAGFGIAASAAEPVQNQAVKKTSDAMNDLGKNMNKAGDAIKSTMSKAESNVKAGAKSDTAKNLENGAKNAMKTVEVNADKAERAIVTTVKGAGKNIGTATGASKPAPAKGDKSPAQKSMDDIGKKLQKAGDDMERESKRMGAAASNQVKKANNALKADKRK